MKWKRKRIGDPDKAVYVSQGLDRQIKVEIFLGGYNVITGEGCDLPYSSMPPGPFPFEEFQDTLKRLNIDVMPHVPKKFLDGYKTKPGEGLIE